MREQGDYFFNAAVTSSSVSPSICALKFTGSGAAALPEDDWFNQVGGANVPVLPGDDWLLNQATGGGDVVVGPHMVGALGRETASTPTA